MTGERTIGRYTYAQAETATTPAGAVTAKTESATLAAANPARVALYITNNGGKDVWLALGSTAVAEKGMKVLATSGTATIDNYSGIVTCITKENESLVSFSEV